MTRSILAILIPKREEKFEFYVWMNFYWFYANLVAILNKLLDFGNGKNDNLLVLKLAFRSDRYR